MTSLELNYFKRFIIFLSSSHVLRAESLICEVTRHCIWWRKTAYWENLTNLIYNCLCKREIEMLDPQVSWLQFQHFTAVDFSGAFHRKVSAVSSLYARLLSWLWIAVIVTSPLFFPFMWLKYKGAPCGLGEEIKSHKREFVWLKLFCQNHVVHL